ncbi:MAG: hypothetical protein OQK94_00985 [Gammaproteobacteria bacterium]|nr:hypothetical protein [Gammaproteobacteria bacterium]MCW8958913.1 hypothetical protein [Gammaproteobacteria bacterium]MCW8992413.1 hypothetical protein [Gammaproteobacteria bacterium]
MTNKSSKENEQMSPLSDPDRDIFLDALSRPARPIPDSIRVAKKRREKIIISDYEKS